MFVVIRSMRTGHLFCGDSVKHGTTENLQHASLFRLLLERESRDVDGATKLTGAVVIEPPVPSMSGDWELVPVELRLGRQGGSSEPVEG